MWGNKRDRCKEQTFGLCGRRWKWDNLREEHWNIYITICEIDCQSRFYAWDRVLRASALGWPWGMEWGGRWEEGSGWETHVYPWLIHVNVWQKPLQYCKIISLQLKQIMATHSIILAWRIPGTEEPGGLPAMGSHRVGHDWSDLAAVAAKQINFFKKP